MEFIFGTRGHIDCTEKMIRNLRSVWMKHEWTTKHGVELKAMEMNIKPILLWDISFPKEQLDTVLNTLLDPGWEENMGKKYGRKFNMISKFLMKKLGLMPIPKERAHNSKWGVYKESVEIFPFGIKKDGEFIDGAGKKVEGI